jgi:hypothetical protein
MNPHYYLHPRLRLAWSGLYTVVMKKQVGDESRVNMPLFFGLVGFFNIIFLMLKNPTSPKNRGMFTRDSSPTCFFITTV